MLRELNKNEIKNILQKMMFGHIGCHADGVTYIVPICYAYDNECIFCRTSEGLKLRLLRENPAVCFQVENIDTILKWESVVCWGTFHELSQKDERMEAIRVLQQRVLAKVDSDELLRSPYWPFALSGSKDDGVFFCIQLKEMTGRSSIFESV
ncbi:pyridoxamine 5'-phosphate oxidase family protein [Niabella hibiscisoli]|uniref:pyridoxamine 5'-phosphate oxidase family protein n=1 Tax=Niabella hibiscisoli TaxID=1825928 RepID=UPI001F0F1CB7|nr:pyridoxamine 5'-phosphate oxidase family protein [Niabella hibiscisoli]MCH5720837.1 pyridoxamine 5'-phosphate oxidase family protein [Niabella hibiscisoli]